MKKFIMSKSKEDKPDSGSPPNQCSSLSPLGKQDPDGWQATSPQNQFSESSLMSPESASKEPINIHPPLPVDPPMSPLKSPKKEMLDEPETEDSDLEAIPTNQVIKTENEPSKNKKPTICRDFVRGTCSRVDCRFLHKRDPSQLMGIITFCHNYQNNKPCPYVKCRFVHATISEQEKFFRTGILPPNAMSRHLMPPPPPPADRSAKKLNSPPKSELGIKSPHCIQSSDKSENCPVRMTNVIINGNESKGTTCNNDERKAMLNPNWNAINEDSKRECPTCDLKENRVKNNTGKLDEYIESAIAISRKMSILNVQMKRLMLLRNALPPNLTSVQQANIMPIISLVEEMLGVKP